MFTSVESLLHAAEAGDKPLWEVILEDDMADRSVEREASWKKMTGLWHAMQAAEADYDPARRSASGLVGGEGGRMAEDEASLCGPFLQDIITTALKMGECNACMRRIVAAPTAGACGVLPAVLLPMQRRYHFSEEQMVQALYISAGFGQVIAARASISGAEGGCQAEIGSASGMAAAAITFLMGGSPRQMAHACAMALSNILGLVCDPVAGLVEVPCVKRNVMGASNALVCAQMALSGLINQIPCDEVIDAMGAVGASLPSALRETGEGGLAATPFGRKVSEQMRGQ
ncbi:L-serine ammonia-lyase, iron-sulfur-dependent, subunit alpha [Flavonifractor sp. An135]|nr:L-serine ammonia-lyase, iron-sulfur-dependent, subunit alpha [Flavonifractor sp. An135]OUQ22628.1 L-serine ammonia-lyase, iron-sulfur-dependent, subunit alpha [Flavonifractor sp. An135]